MNNTTYSRRYLLASALMTMLIAGPISTALATGSSSGVIYVNANASGGDGTTWAKAFKSLNSALLAAAGTSGADQIWVAKGTYKPSVPYVQAGYPGNPTQANLRTFLLPSNVSIYGGFVGNETYLSQRQPNKNPTILSGDLNGNDINDIDHAQMNKTDNAWHVLTAMGSTGVLLDGLTITDGYAGGADFGSMTPPPIFKIASIDYTYAAGGGMLLRNGAKVSLNNVLMNFNASDTVNATILGPDRVGFPAEASVGGAIAVLDNDSTLSVVNSNFTNNTAFGAGGKGGALSALLEGNINVSLSSFSNNSADRNGGAVHSAGGNNIFIVLSDFRNNKAVSAILPDAAGGAIGVINANLKVSASNFQNNVSGILAGGGGGIFFHIAFDDGDPYTFSIDTSIFKNNVGAAFGGGGILVLANNPHTGSSASITTSVFTNNNAGVGGGIYADGVPTTIAYDAFYSNQAWVNGGAILGSAFGNALFGATDLAGRPPITISNSVFAGNSIVGIPSTAIIPPKDFFNIVATVFGGQSVSTMSAGGAAVAGQLGANLGLSNNVFINNNAGTGRGGALLVGGSVGSAVGFNQAYATFQKGLCLGNTDSTGNNNKAVLDLANLGNTPTGVSLVSDGTCP